MIEQSSQKVFNYSIIQVFIRRIVQLRAEIEDGRDLVLELCKSFLPEAQWRIISEDLQVLYQL